MQILLLVFGGILEYIRLKYQTIVAEGNVLWIEKDCPSSVEDNEIFEHHQDVERDDETEA